MAVKLRVVISLLCGFLECVFFSVPHLGWPSLVYVYKKMRLFSSYCEDFDHQPMNMTSITDGNGSNSVTECDIGIADNYYNLAYNVAVSSQMFLLVPIGIFFDHYGILKTRIASL